MNFDEREDKRTDRGEEERCNMREWEREIGRRMKRRREEKKRRGRKKKLNI